MRPRPVPGRLPRAVAHAVLPTAATLLVLLGVLSVVGLLGMVSPAVAGTASAGTASAGTELVGTALVGTASAGTELVGTGTATTDDSPDAPPEETSPPTTVPKNVLSWFVGPGLEAAVAEAEQLPGGGGLVIGPPHPVHRWTTDFLDGAQNATATAPDGQWVAAVLRTAPDAAEGQDAEEGQAAEEAPDAAVPVGVLRAGPFDGTEPEVVVVSADADVAALLAEEDLTFTVVYDEAVGGWFGTAEGEAWSIGAQAREVLHGAVPLPVLQVFLTELGADPTATSTDVGAVDEDNGWVPLTVIAVIVLVGLVGAWLLARNYRKADSRLEADIRAGLTPLEGIARLDTAGSARAQHRPPPLDGPDLDEPQRR